MSEGRTVFLFGLGLVVLVALLQWGISASDDRESSRVPTTSATPTNPAEPEDAGCPAALELPDGVTDQVCLPVAGSDLTALGPTEDAQGKSVTGFRSPSGAIACTDIRGETVACAVKDWTFDAPGEAEQGNTVVIWSGRDDLPDADVQPAAVAVDAPATFSVPRLQFGQVVRMNAGWFCGVEEVGVACWSSKGKSGILVSRSQWTTWSPAGIEAS